MASEKPTKDEERLFNSESDDGIETNEDGSKLIALRRDPINPIKSPGVSSTLEGEDKSIIV